MLWIKCTCVYNAFVDVWLFLPRKITWSWCTYSFTSINTITCYPNPSVILEKWQNLIKQKKNKCISLSISICIIFPITSNWIYIVWLSAWTLIGRTIFNISHWLYLPTPTRYNTTSADSCQTKTIHRHSLLNTILKSPQIFLCMQWEKSICTFALEILKSHNHRLLLFYSHWWYVFW